MKRADKLGAQVALILGEDEVNNQQVAVKNLKVHGEQQTVAWSDVADAVSNLIQSS